MQWLSLIIPLIVIVIGLIWYRKELVWWEYLTILFFPVLFILVATSIIKNQVPESTAANSFYSTNAIYDEYWNEFIVKTCTEQYACGTVSTGKGKRRTKYCTRTYDCSYVKNHPAQWSLNFSGGQSLSINSSEFAERCSKWGTQQFVEMNRRYYSIDGNRYTCAWDKKPENVSTFTTPQVYENRILGTKNVFGFRQVDSLDVARYGLPNSPTDDFKPTTQFLYTIGTKISPSASRELYQSNGLFGSSKKMTLLMVVFENKPSDVCDVLESYWSGGKKNEVTLCVNLNQNQVANAKVISWAKDNLFKIQIRDSVASLKTFDSDQAAKILSHFAKKSYQLRDFHEFDYIEIEMELKTWHYIMIWILVILLSCGIAYIVINNRFKHHRDWLEDQ
jgi:hypothetical protein